MRRAYGSSPLHLIGHLALFGLAAYAIVQILSLGESVRVLLWLGCAVLLHDAVLWPLYSGADSLGRRLLGGAINHVRVPAGLSLLLALVFIGTVSGRGEAKYARASGRMWDGYVTRWALVSLGLFAVSAVVYLVRRR